MTKTAIKSRRPLSFFLIMGLIGLFAVFVGFAKTFIIPQFTGTFKAPLIIYVHGGFAFAWIALFAVQSILIQNRQLSFHRSLGYAGIFIALGAGFTIVPAGLYAVETELSKGFGPTAISGILGIITAALMFLTLFAAAMSYRSRPQVHKRLMLLATITLLWPAWFRFRHYFPSIPDPQIWFALVLADSLILFSFIWDKLRNGRILPSLLYTGLFIIAEHTLEVITFDSPVWRTISNMIYDVLT